MLPSCIIACSKGTLHSLFGQSFTLADESVVEGVTAALTADALITHQATINEDKALN